MSKEDDYRWKAAETVQLAQRAGSTADKGRLLKLAESWLDLAERVHAGRRHAPLKLHLFIQQKH
jgi:hypothetical protein